MRWLLLALVLVVGVVQSQEPPKAKVPQEKASTEQRATEKTPLFVRTPEPTTQAERNHEAYEKQQKLWNETALAYATIALAWITLFLSLFTGGLWIATRTLVNDAKKSSERQLRAYISSSPDFIFNFSSTQFAQMEYTVENLGQTPAYNFSRSAIVEILPHPLLANFRFPELPIATPETYALQPRQKTTTKIAARRYFSDQEIRDAAGNNGCRIYCFGIVKYFDAFGCEHRTRFCRSIIGTDDLLAVGTTGLDRRVDIEYEISHQHNEAD